MMHTQVKNNLDLLRDLATGPNLSTSAKVIHKPKIKSMTIKKDGLISLLRTKKDAAVFMSRLNTIINSSKMK